MFSGLAAYDLNHKVTQVTDAAGHITKAQYDLDGLLTQQTDASGNTTLLTLDADGQVTQQEVPAQKPGAPVAYDVTQYVYDQDGNQTQVISPRGVASGTCAYTTQTQYNPDGQVAKVLAPYLPGDPTYCSLAQTSYSYNPDGRLTEPAADRDRQEVLHRHRPAGDVVHVHTHGPGVDCGEAEREHGHLDLKSAEREAKEGITADCSGRLFNLGACPSEAAAAGTTPEQVDQSLTGAGLVLSSTIPVGDILDAVGLGGVGRSAVGRLLSLFGRDTQKKASASCRKGRWSHDRETRRPERPTAHSAKYPLCFNLH